MKTGMTLTQLATELERQRDVKKDYVADSRLMTLAPTATSLVLADKGAFDINEMGHEQLATRLDISRPFYDRLREKHPDLLAHNVNELFKREPKKSMVRTLDSRVRAIKSDSFRPLDNYDMAEAILPELQQAGAQVVSCQLTERRMYIKALCPWLDRELPVPEGVVMGQGHTIFLRRVVGAITIGNSETGYGSIFVDPGLWERQCSNLATFRGEGYRKIHVGKAKGADDEINEYLSDDTKRLEDAAVWAKVRDIVRATMDGRVIDSIVAKATAARNDLITGDPAKVVEVFAKRNQLTEGERGGLLRHLVGSGEMTRYGLQWAVTRLAGEVEDYDRASDLERLGGSVIELPRTDWQVLARAA